MASFARGFTVAYRLVWRASPGMLVMQAALAVVSGAAPIGVAWLMKAVLDRLSRGRLALDQLLWPAAGIGVLTIVLAVCPAMSAYAAGRLRRAAGLRAQDHLFSAVNRLRGLSRLEDPAFHDRLRLAQQSAQTAPDQLVSVGLQALQGGLTVLGFAATLAAIGPLMAVAALLAAVPAMFAQLALSRRRAGLAWSTSPAARRQLFYQQLLTDEQAAKEVRLFGLGDFLHGRMLTELRAVNRKEDRLEARAVGIQACLALLGALLSAAGLLWAVREAVTGAVSLGEVSVFVTALAGVQSCLGTLVQNVATGHQAALLMGHFLAVTGVRDDLAPGPGTLPGSALRTGVELRDVWFRYGEDGPWVLRGVNLSIPHGTSLAVVGANGAGKSTLVKLLCRFYDPQRGSVLWDGVDIRELAVDDLRARIGAVFQDYMEYDLTAAENIGIGDIARIDDDEAIRDAAVRADVHRSLEKLPRGYGTLLSRLFFVGEDDDPSTGVRLSGGQWQRLAFARGLMREGRDLMILDEPSSGLDAMAERRVHDRLRELRTGATSLLVSHRLNAVRQADAVAVVSDGQVVEYGGHDELVAAGGEYARMFRTQAEGYQAGISS
ncbi:ABC transporter ATP-binding protein [Streptomyces sp. ME01-24h]|nr:ABC transporter ATP-binding protein [Streptomyces sp. ME01-24h]